MTLSSASTSTAPTHGFGEARAMPLRASSSACCMKASSLEVSLISIEQRIHEVLRVEGQKIADFFTNPNVSHRQAKFLGDSHYHTALGSAVELGEHNSGDAGRLREQTRLLQTVLAGGGVHHQQGLVGGVGAEALRGAAHLRQLLHQAGLGMQAA